MRTCNRVHDETVWDAFDGTPEGPELEENPEIPLRVNIPHHLPVDLDECEVGKLVAVRSRPSFYRERPYPSFWIAKITNLDREMDELVLTYYRRSEVNPEYFTYAVETSGRIQVSAVLAYGFTLTTTRKVRAVTYRAIARVLDIGD